MPIIKGSRRLLRTVRESLDGLESGHVSPVKACKASCQIRMQEQHQPPRTRGLGLSPASAQLPNADNRGLGSAFRPPTAWSRRFTFENRSTYQWFACSVAPMPCRIPSRVAARVPWLGGGCRRLAEAIPRPSCGQSPSRTFCSLHPSRAGWLMLLPSRWCRQGESSPQRLASFTCDSPETSRTFWHRKVRSGPRQAGPSLS